MLLCMQPKPVSSSAMVIGERIAAWRRLRGMTQQQLGHALGLKKSSISRYESGETTPDAHQVEHIARVLSLTMAEFYGADLGHKRSNVARAS